MVSPTGVGLLPVPFLAFFKITVEFAILLFKPITGDPWTLFSLNKVPSLKFTFEFLNSSLSLVLSTSMIVVPDFSISYPLTYALPGDTLSANKSSDGVAPWSVNSSDVKIPSFDIPSFNDSNASSLKFLRE